MGAESQAWDTLRPALKRACVQRGLPLHLLRVENTAHNGAPDVNLCVRGVEAWLEGKHIKQLPKRPATGVKLGMREVQADFAAQRVRAGGRVLCWVRVAGEGWLMFEGCLSTTEAVLSAQHVREQLALVRATKMVVRHVKPFNCPATGASGRMMFCAADTAEQLAHALLDQILGLSGGAS